MGLLMAWWGVDLLVSLSPRDIPRLEEINLDGRVVVFTLVTAIITSLIFGLTPALHLSNPDLHGAIKQGAARGSVSRAGGRLRGALVGLQVALCMTLMIAAGLLSRGLYATYTADPGFVYRDVGYADLEELGSAGYEEAQAEALQRLLLYARSSLTSGRGSSDSAGSIATRRTLGPMRQRTSYGIVSARRANAYTLAGDNGSGSNRVTSSPTVACGTSPRSTVVRSMLIRPTTGAGRPWTITAARFE